MVPRPTLLLETRGKFGTQRIMQFRTLNQDLSCFAEVSKLVLVTKIVSIYLKLGFGWAGIPG
jgi:hypothetical protein